MKFDEVNDLDCPPAEALYDELLLHGDGDSQFESRQPNVAATLRLLHDVLRPTPTVGRDFVSNESRACPVLPSRFEIRGELGRGGFGVVYHSFDKVLQRDVAIKVPHAPLRAIEELRLRFLRESRAVARLNHPSIVRVLEAGEFQEVPFQVAEYVHGESLSEYLRRHTRLDMREAASIVLELADGVQHAHDHQVLHRDIKPDNILLEPLDGDHAGRLIPRLTDFGLARLLDDDTTRSRDGLLLGTPRNMAPEQLTGDLTQHGPATDVYALGVILYELLTGSPPFPEARTIQARMALLNTSPPSPQVLRAAVSRDLNSICLKCLEYKPEDRYRSAAALRDDLQCYLDGRGTQARPRPALEQLLRWGIRHRMPATVLSLFVLFVALLMGLMWHTNVRSRHQNALVSAEQRKYRELAWNSGIQKASTAWSQLRILETQNILEGLAKSHPESLSRPEWWLLDKQLKSRFRVLLTTDSPVHELRKIPGKRSIAAAEEDGTVYLLNADTGQTQRVIHTGLPSIHALAITPDGRDFVAGGSVDKTDFAYPVLFNLESGAPLREFPPQPTTIESLAFFKDRSKLACGCRYEPVQVFDLPKSSVLPLHGTSRNQSLDVTSDGRWLASQCEWDAIRISKMANATRFLNLEMYHPIKCFRWVPGTNLLACGSSSSCRISVIDVGTGDTLFRLGNTSGNIECLEVTEGTHTVLAGLLAGFIVDSNSTIHAGLSNGSVLSWTLPASISNRRDPIVTYTPRKSVIVREKSGLSVSPDNEWQLNDAQITSLCVVNDRLFASSTDGSVVVWGLGESAQVSYSSPDSKLMCGAFTADRSDAFVAFGNDTVRFLRCQPVRAASSSDCQSRLPADHVAWGSVELHTPRRVVLAVGFSADGRLVGLADHSGAVRVRDKVNAENIVEFPPKFAANGSRIWPRAVGFSYSSDRVAWTGGSRFLYVAAVDSASRKPLELPLPGDGHTFAFSPDGTWIACGGDFESIQLFDCQSGLPISNLPNGEDCRSLLFTHDGSKLISGHRDGTIRIRLLHGHPDLTLHMHKTTVTSLALSRDGRLGFSVDQSTQVILWSVETGERIGALFPSNDVAESSVIPPQIAFSADDEDFLLLTSVPTKGLRIHKWSSPHAGSSTSKLVSSP